MASITPPAEFEPVDLSKEYHGKLPELGRFKANPTPETHQEAAKLLHKTGPLTLDGDLFELVDGKVKFGPAPDHSKGISVGP